MKNKLMISALLFCSSLSFAGGDLSTATPAPEKKKALKVMVAPSTTAQHPDDVGTVGTGGMGTAGTGAPRKSDSIGVVRGKPQPKQK